MKHSKLSTSRAQHRKLPLNQFLLLLISECRLADGYPVEVLESLELLDQLGSHIETNQLETLEAAERMHFRQSLLGHLGNASASVLPDLERSVTIPSLRLELRQTLEVGEAIVRDSVADEAKESQLGVGGQLSRGSTPNAEAPANPSGRSSWLRWSTARNTSLVVMAIGRRDSRLVASRIEYTTRMGVMQTPRQDQAGCTGSAAAEPIQPFGLYRRQPPAQR